jgi:GT2 family glycosyltransferase
MSAEPGITFDRERTPYSEAWELRRLRRELAEKNRLIATLTRQINSPVFLLRAALRNLIYLIPYVVRRLRDRRFEKELLRKVELIRNSRMFDEQWYLSRYPDVAEAGTDPIMHYIMSGAAEGRDPCPGFSTRAYLRNCLDVAAASANPLVHYIEHGRKEGRQAVGHEYQLWVERFDTLTDADRVVIKSAIDRFSMRPLISVLMPVYNTEPKWLTRAIESVRAQLYPNWELCISDNASTSSHVREILNAYAQIDERIRIFYRDTNGHISRNSNSALALATGEFVALMDSDDELAEHALFWVANEILCHPDVDLIYSDEDKIDVVGQRYDAYFKPDWNPALMLSQNTFSHLGVYRRSLVEKVGGFRAGFEGSQDHDLVLRCADVSAPERIRHIPRVLYHWRSMQGSTAVSIDAKPYAWQAGAHAIKEHCERHNIAANVSRARSQFYRVDYEVGARLPKVSIVMPTTGNLKLLKPCIQSLFARTTYPDFEILIAISKSHRAIQERGDYLDELGADSRVRIFAHEVEPYSFAKVNNWAIQYATGSVICLLNDDVEVITPDWLEKLVMRLELDRVGAVGPMLYFPDDTIQHAGVILGLRGVAGHAFIGVPKGSGGYFGRAALEQDFSCITAACMVMRRALFEKLNGFNEDLAIAYNDVDLCIRMRQAGWRIIWTPQVEMYHHESASLGHHSSPERKATFEREVSLMREMWGAVLDNDPFYNPNLSLSTNDFTLAFPPRLSHVPGNYAINDNETRSAVRKQRACAKAPG